MKVFNLYKNTLEESEYACNVGCHFISLYNYERNDMLATVHDRHSSTLRDQKLVVDDCVDYCVSILGDVLLITDEGNIPSIELNIWDLPACMRLTVDSQIVNEAVDFRQFKIDNNLAD